MAVIESKVSVGSETFRENAEGMRKVLDRVRELENRTRLKSESSKERFKKRGQLLPRERIALVLDPGASFLELSTLAGFGLDTPDLEQSVPGGGVVAGIGYVSGVRVMIAAKEELGVAEMHTSISGLGDYLAEDDRDALRMVREIVAKLDWNDRVPQTRTRAAAPRYDASELMGLLPVPDPADLSQQHHRLHGGHGPQGRRQEADDGSGGTLCARLPGGRPERGTASR